jgi:hypothetical protein
LTLSVWLQPRCSWPSSSIHWNWSLSSPQSITGASSGTTDSDLDSLSLMSDEIHGVILALILYKYGKWVFEDCVF